MSSLSRTITQQRALAYAPKPLALLSFLSSSYVVYHLTRQESHKCKRLYHRLVRAMCIAELPLAVAQMWGSWAVPLGTPNFAGAAGTIQTCTGQGFMALMFGLNIPVYYASLSIYSFLAVKNNFRQEKFEWIEKWIHGVAYVMPLVLCCITLAKESFNPRGTGCFLAAYPLGCENDPDVICVRGGSASKIILDVFAIGNLLLYLIIPPSALILVACWIRRTSKQSSVSVGMSQVRAAARKQMTCDVMKQMGLYLTSFWFTYIFSLANALIEKATGLPNTDILIIANCFVALQGVIIAMVYFALQEMANSPPRLSALPHVSDTAKRPKGHLTVSKIRENVEARDNMRKTIEIETEETGYGSFFIFDGTPSDDSPWAKYLIDQDESDDGSEDKFGENNLAAKNPLQEDTQT